jgi:hypothetical protein
VLICGGLQAHFADAVTNYEQTGDALVGRRVAWTLLEDYIVNTMAMSLEVLALGCESYSVDGGFGYESFRSLSAGQPPC